MGLISFCNWKFQDYSRSSTNNLIVVISQSVPSFSEDLFIPYTMHICTQDICFVMSMEA